MNIIFHPEVMSVDLPRIEQEMNDASAFAEFMMCVDRAIIEMAKRPVDNGAPLLFPPLQDYRKKKFHSKLKPHKNISADMRLIYRCDCDRGEILIGAIWVIMSSLP